MNADDLAGWQELVLQAPLTVFVVVFAFMSYKAHKQNLVDHAEMREGIKDLSHKLSTDIRAVHEKLDNLIQALLIRNDIDKRD